MTELQQHLNIVATLLPHVEGLAVDSDDRGTWVFSKETGRVYIQLDDQNRVVSTSGELDDHFPEDPEAHAEWDFETDARIQVEKILDTGWSPEDIDRLLQDYIDEERVTGPEMSLESRIRMEALFRVRKSNIAKLEAELQAHEGWDDILEGVRVSERS